MSPDHEHLEYLTQEQCRGYQGACKGDVVSSLRSLGSKIDAQAAQIGEMREDLRVIKDRLAINGGDAPHQHHRDSEETTRLHRRIDDLTKLVATGGKATPTADETLRERVARNWREILLIALGAIAGERVLTEIPHFIRDVFQAFTR